MNIEFKRFCDNIRVLRKNKGLSQKELAEKIEVSKASIGGIESFHPTSFDVMFRLADFFDVSVSDLFGREFEINNNIEFKPIRKGYGRFSGLQYENTPERLEQIKKKYSNGVTMDILKEMFNI
jgi:transcriptional regulator with XRE-family HTH domain